MVPSDQLQQIFIESASEVLETMFFVRVLGENPASAVAADLVSAELIFNGSPSGRFGVQMPPSTAKLIAANFLGKEAEEISEAETGQVAGELANMICGSVLSRVEAAARFELLHPVILAPGQGSPHPEAISSSLELEEGVMVLWMSIGETQAATHKPRPSAAA